MKEINIHVPIGCEYLSMWRDFDSALPPGHIILNKSICGCGCTDYYLTNELAVILVSPRRRLIESKLEDPRTCCAYYFDRSADEPVQATKDKLKSYLWCCGPTPFSPPKASKIMVTYDSLGIVIDALTNWGYINQFTIVVDEFTCIFSDAKLKGFTEINLLHQLNRLQNRIVYISATPMKDIYLELLDEFKDIPVVNLEWDGSRIERAHVYYSQMVSCAAAFEKIYKEYTMKRYFKSKIINGQTYYSKEGVFFMNSVKDIVGIIKKNSLTPKDALIICADTNTNRAALKGVGFHVGKVPGKNNYQISNKPFTFVTKCSFEGTDFYSDSSTTFVFSDCNRENMTLDISIDLPQIAGRCRSRNNVFRNDIYYYYKNVNTEHFDVKELTQEIFERRERTLKSVKSMSGTPVGCLNTLILNGQKVEKYSQNYLDIEKTQDGTDRLVCNDLVFAADLRAIEIKSQQYTNTYQMICYMNDAGFSATHLQSQADQQYNRFMLEFLADNNFERRMRLYVETVENAPILLEMVENTSAIPLEYKKYYRLLGAERIRRCAFIEANLRRELNDSLRGNDVSLDLEPDRTYSNAEIKAMLQAEYNRLGMYKTAKATDISEYVKNAIRTRYMDADGKKQNGYKIKPNEYE